MTIKYVFNFQTGCLDAIDSIPNPILFKGNISVNTDFPLIADVQTGWFYTISASVTDDAGVTYTNTGQAFINQDEIAWNGTNWSLLGNNSSYVRLDGTTTGATSQAQAFTNGVITPKIYPSADSTTAVGIFKADGTTNILNVNTTNSRIGVGTIAPSSLFHVTSNSAALQTIFRVDGSGSTSNYFGLSNLGGAVDNFITGFISTNILDNRQAVSYIAQTNTTQDNGTTPITIFDSRRTTGVVETRPLFSWENYGSGKMQMSASGGLSLGSTFFSTDAGANNLLVEGRVGIGTINPESPFHVGGVTPSITQKVVRATTVGLAFSMFNLIAERTVSTPTIANLAKIGARGEMGAGAVAPYAQMVGFQVSDPSNASWYDKFNLAVGRLGAVGINPTGLTINADLAAENTYGLKVYSKGAYIKGAGSTTGKTLSLVNSTPTEIFTVLDRGNVGIGTTTPSAYLHLKAGTATASTAPLKFTSGTLNTTPEDGALEYLTDNLHFTIATGTARKGIVLDDGTRLTSGKIPVATTNGRLIDLTAQTELTDEDATATDGTDATQDQLINNMRTRINELETKLVALGLLVDAD
jgi:hypothetical protein